MPELPEDVRNRVEQALKQSVGKRFTSFHLRDDGVIEVGVPNESVAQGIPGTLAGYPVESRFESFPSPDVCFYGVTNPTVGDRKMNVYDPMPTGVRVIIGSGDSAGYCTRNVLCVRNGEYFLLTAGHCALQSDGSYQGPMRYRGTRVGRTFHGPTLTEDGPNYDYAYTPYVGADVSEDETAYKVNTELLGLDAGPGIVADPEQGMNITMLSSFSGEQNGNIAQTGVTFGMNVAAGDYYFASGFTTTESISQPGDSGSVAVTQDSNGVYHPVGVLSGSSDTNSYFIALRPILQQSGLKILTGEKAVRLDMTEEACNLTPPGDVITGGRDELTFSPG